MLPNFAAVTYLEMDSQDESARIERYHRARCAYNGEYPKPLSGKGRTITVNYARKIVNAGVSYLFGKEGGIVLSTDEGARERNDAETYLDRVLAANHWPILLNKLGVNGGITGDPYIKIQRRSRLTGALPRLIVMDPSYVRAEWEADDVEDVWRYTVQYPDVDRRTGKPIERRQVMERSDTGAWSIADYVRPAGGTWVQEVSEPWPYPFAPMLHCQNLPTPNEFYGLADLDGDVLDLVESINYTLTNLDRVMDNYGHPVIYGKGLNGDVDRKPGKIIGLGPNGELGMLQPQGVDESSINVYLRKKEALHEVAELPEVASGKLENTGQLSGTALRILYGPIMERTMRKRATYGAMLVDLAKRLLAVGELATYGEQDVMIQWPEILPSDPVQERAVAEADVRLGASKDSQLEKFGYNPAAEAEKRQAEIQQEIDNQAARTAAMPQPQPFGGR